jgi:hypothetical protein
MGVIRTYVIVVILAVSGLLARPAQAAAQTAVKLVYWPASVSGSVPGFTFATWNTGFVGADLRRETQSPWGFHLQFVTGGQSDIAGLPATGGTDRIWSGDVSYRWQGARTVVRAFAGYGSYHTEWTDGVNITAGTSSGLRLGVDLSVLAGERWRFNASYAYSPSNRTSTNILPSTATASAYDWSASVQYTTSGGWSLEAGYRVVSTDSGALPGYCFPDSCNAHYSGGLFTVGRTF